LITVPKRTPDLERIRQLQDAVAAGLVKAGVTYSADQVAKLLGWNAKTAKRLLPLVQASQQLPFPCEWEENATAGSMRYFFRIKKI
jgi:hypothetical protein